MKKLTHHGLTTVELLAILVILAIISAVAVVSLSTLLDNTRLRADQANVISLNQATRLLKMHDETGFENFMNLETDEAKMNALYTMGYLNQPIRMQHSETFYSFDQSVVVWCFQQCPNFVSLFDFSQPTFNLNDFQVKRSQDAFVISEGALVATPPNQSDDIIFFPNPRSAYTIEVTAQIQPRLGGNNRGGFGVLFETSFRNNDPNRDDGYIVQLDRHEGQIIIRPRNNGNEQNIVLRYNVNIVNGNANFTPGGSTSNTGVRDDPWWEQSHTLKLSVSEDGSNKTLSVWLNDVFVFSWAIPNPIASEDAALNMTGLRTWWQVPVIFEAFDIYD